MSEPTKQNIGYFVAGFGALVLLITLFLLYSGTLTTTDGKGILMTLIVVSGLLIGLGMYVVVPKEAHDAVNDFGGVARDIIPLRSRAQQPPVNVAPAPGQSAVVQPPAGDAVVVGPTGDVAPAADPETATGAALPLITGEARRAPPRVRAPITGAQRSRQELYPHDEA